MKINRIRHITATTVRRLLHLSTAALCLLTATACRDDFNTDVISEPGKLVVSCTPTTGSDTTWIDVTYSRPVSAKDSATEWLQPATAHVSYSVNGHGQPVGQRADGLYYVTATHRAGDHVALTVSADGYSTVSSQTTIPQPCTVTLDTITQLKAYDPRYAQSEEYTQLAATFTDPADSQDYYAVRVCCRQYKAFAYYWTYDNYYKEWTKMSLGQSTYEYLESIKQYHTEYEFGYELIDSIDTYPEISVHGEPVLATLSEIDYDFGFDDFYQQRFYIFSDELINGQTYTLHLNINKYHWAYDWKFMICYQVQFYHITPEMYRYAKSLNDIENNELAQGGFSLLRPTYSNIQGGIGLLAGYNMSSSMWYMFNQ